MGFLSKFKKNLEVVVSEVGKLATAAEELIEPLRSNSVVKEIEEAAAFALLRSGNPFGEALGVTIEASLALEEVKEFQEALEEKKEEREEEAETRRQGIFAIPLHPHEEPQQESQQGGDAGNKTQNDTHNERITSNAEEGRHNNKILDKELQSLEEEEVKEVDLLARLATKQDPPVTLEDFIKDLNTFETPRAKQQYVEENFTAFSNLPQNEINEILTQLNQ